MNFVENFKFVNSSDNSEVTAAQIPCITGEGEPTTATEGAVGCFYMDTETGDTYKCVSVVEGVYTWKPSNELLKYHKLTNCPVYTYNSLYVEKDPNADIYYIKVILNNDDVETGGDIGIYGSDFGDTVRKWVNLIQDAELAKHVCTSPNGVSKCIKISSYYSLGFDVTTKTFFVKKTHQTDWSTCIWLFGVKNGVRGGALSDNRLINLPDEIDSIKSHLETGVSSEVVPTYWKEHLSEKIAIISNRAENVALNGDSFIFLTDYHIEENCGKSHLLIDEIIKNTSIQKVICGGDLFNGSDTVQGSLTKLNEWRKRFKKFNLYCVRGNHEYNTIDTNTTDDVRLTESQIYNYIQKENESNVEHYVGGATYGESFSYYIDNEKQKIRYIFMDTKLTTGNTSACISTVEMNWLTNKIAELEEGWSVVVISHAGLEDYTLLTSQPSDWNTEYKQYYKLVDGEYVALTTEETFVNDTYYRLLASSNVYRIKKGIDTAISTTDNKATVICWINGHNHKDRSIQDALGYQIISTTADCLYAPSTTREEGTTSEQAFDVFSIDTANKRIYATRIGAGNDREWSYGEST